MKWGLLGGTFDPIHFGHLRCAQEVLEIFELDKIIFIPAFHPPLKTRKDITSFRHRQRMVELATSVNQLFSASDIEGRRKGKSYSIETVKHFLKEHGKDLTLFFILGQDAFQGIKMWKDWEKLLLLCNFVVMTRPGYKIKRLQELLPHDFASQFKYNKDTDGFKGPTGHSIFFREVTFLDISSTDIRDRVKNGKSIKYIAPEVVCDYISEHLLYRRVK
ncbi:MAG: nicotinate-nucleotide adenylyltransferase [Thermodesulfobacteriota bacterium]|nr:nicotinate-nucleotide adenylyltransferase [Thermodesulfobacteriota bacterium]